MKRQRVLIGLLAGTLLQLVLVGGASGYSLLLPDVAAGSCEGATGLPYTALADHYTGPACVQMVLYTCPTTTQRACHTQSDLYNLILLHNSEPLSWFSDPDGIEGTLEDPSLSPCGNWVDYSDTDKAHVLGKMLYYMRTQKYLTPVSIGTGEHWVVVIGYETDIEPPFAGAVTLNNIFFYDPLPGSPSLGWVSGSTWLLGTGSPTPSYWEAPLNLPGSAWDGKYVAVIEPPGATLVVKIPRWTRERILPPDVILRSVQKWLKEIHERELARGPFKALGRDLEVRKPILVNAERPYYLVGFDDDRVMAVFSGDGSFEELRLFEKPQKQVPNEHLVKHVGESLRERGLRLVKAEKPELVFRPEMSRVGRVAPTWEVATQVSDAAGRSFEATLQLDMSGTIVGGLDPLLRKVPRPR